MITRAVRLRLLVFGLVSLLGIGYVAVHHLKLGERLFGGAYLIHADFKEAGGIFPDASVTYRGVPVGRVAAVRLREGGVRVDLRLASDVQVPTNVSAVVTLRSAVGEQYVDLRPETGDGPFLNPGDTIPVARTSIPLPVETLLANLDALVGSVDPEDMRILIDELGTAFAGNETALRRLLDSNNLLLADAVKYLPQTTTLIADGRTVLATQVESAQAIRRWAKGLAGLAAAMRTADPDLRNLLAQGPPAAVELSALLRDLDPTIGTLLGNLITVNGIGARRVAGIEQLLVVYPLVVAGGFTVLPGDGTAHLGLVLNLNDPHSCQYPQTGQRRCTDAENGHGSGVRGNRHAPRPGGAETSPAPLPPGSRTGPSSSPMTSGSPAGPHLVAGFDPVTGLVVGPAGTPLQFGADGGQHALAGDQSWKLLLLAGVAP